MIDGPSDRRSLLRSAFQRWAGNVMERTEQRMVAKHYQRPPGALMATAVISAGRLVTLYSPTGPVPYP